MNTINTYFLQYFLNHIIHIILNNVNQTPLSNKQIKGETISAMKWVGQAYSMS